MQALHFIYFADPMCSWCYGFSPTVELLRRRYGDILKGSAPRAGAAYEATSGERVPPPDAPR